MPGPAWAKPVIYSPCRVPWDWLPVGLALFENPKGGFRQVASGGADGDGMALASAGTLVELDDVLATPVGVVPLPDEWASMKAHFR